MALPCPSELLAQNAAAPGSQRMQVPAGDFQLWGSRACGMESPGKRGADLGLHVKRGATNLGSLPLECGLQHQSSQGAYPDLPIPSTLPKCSGHELFGTAGPAQPSPGSYAELLPPPSRSPKRGSAGPCAPATSTAFDLRHAGFQLDAAPGLPLPSPSRSPVRGQPLQSPIRRNPSIQDEQNLLFSPTRSPQRNSGLTSPTRQRSSWEDLDLLMKPCRSPKRDGSGLNSPSRSTTWGSVDLQSLTSSQGSFDQSEIAFDFPPMPVPRFDVPPPVQSVNSSKCGGSFNLPRQEMDLATGFEPRSRAVTCPGALELPSPCSLELGTPPGLELELPHGVLEFQALQRGGLDPQVLSSSSELLGQRQLEQAREPEQCGFDLHGLRAQLEAVLANKIKEGLEGQQPPEPPAARGGDEEALDCRGATTLMIKNVSRTLTRRGLLRVLHKLGFSEQFDYVHLPLDFNTGSNLGFAFVNFTDSAAAQHFSDCVHNSAAALRGVSKHWKISAAKVQGYEANAAVAMSQKKDRIRSRRCKPLVLPREEAQDAPAEEERAT